MARRKHKTHIRRDMREKIPGLGGTKRDLSPMVWVKFRSADCSWYVTEFDGKERCFGYTIGEKAVLGYFRLSDLATREQPVTQDESFIPKALVDLEAAHADEVASPWPRPAGLLHRLVAWKSVADARPDVVEAEIDSLSSADGET